MNRPNLIVVLTVAFAGGIWLGSLYFGSLGFLYGSAAVLISAALWYSFRRPKAAVWLLAAVFFVCGMIRFIHSEALSPLDISQYAGRQGTVVGEIAAVPQVTKLDEGKIKVKYVLAVRKIRFGKAAETATTGSVIVSSRQAENSYIGKYGDMAAMSGKIVSLHGYNNPGQFNSVAALQRQGITARMTVESGSSRFQKAEAPHWQNKVAQWRDSVIAQIQTVLPAGNGAILVGTLFGGYSGITPQVIADFATTGIVHILSVSGSHIALVAGVILWLGSRLKLRQGIVAFFAGFSILFYSVFAGLTPPVIRSAVMGLTALAAMGFAREKDAPAALALAGLSMLVVQPGLIYDISFQLSFGSTAGLVYLYPKTVGRLLFLPRWIAEALAVTLSAQLAVLPFLAWYFNSFSLSSFIANIIVVPIIEAVVVLGLAGVLIGSILSVPGKIILVLCSLLIGLIVQIVTVLAALPGSAVYLPPIGLAGGMVYYLFVGWLYGYQPRRFPGLSELVRRWPKSSAGFIAAAIVLFTGYICYPAAVAVHFIDVGQGDATLITTPHGRSVLVDTGGSLGESTDFDVGARVVVPYLKHYGVRQVDYLVLTHGHQDHAGGAASVVAAIPVRNVMLSREDYSPAVQSMLHAAKNSTIIPIYKGQQIVLDGVRLDILHAAEGAIVRTGNEVSSVVRASYGSHSFLITGDLEAQGEMAMLAGNDSLAATVLKVGHHGSKTASTIPFLQAIDPKYAVISVGSNNRFGHPHPDVLERFVSRDISVLRTDLQGAIVFYSDGSELAVRTFVR
ncbi:MAG: DNA internalization-related competence protein ComEC/Rec2 [Veillonellales bacterium]